MLQVIVALLCVVPAGLLAGLATRRLAPEAGAIPDVMFSAALAVLFLWAALSHAPPAIFAASLGLGWGLLGLAVIDLHCFRLPDGLTLPLIAAGLGVAWLLLPGRPLIDHLAGAAAGWGFLATLAFAYRRLRGGEGIGGGDAKLLAAAGAWLGWRDLPSVILLACGCAFVWIGVMAAFRGAGVLRARLAFGAPLALAIWIVWLQGPIGPG